MATSESKLIELIHRYGSSVRIRRTRAPIFYLGVVLEFAAVLIPSFAITLALVGSFVLAFDIRYSRSMYAAASFIGLVAAISLLIAHGLFRLSRLCLAAHDGSLAISGKAPTILYLRPFSADIELLVNAFARLRRTIFGVFAKFLMSNQRMSGDIESTGVTAWNVETLLCEAMPSWRVVAIGRPDERIQKPGAARLYVDDEHWTSVVTDLMASSELVFVRLNGERTKGIDWEIDTLAKLNYLPKTVILSLDDTNAPLEFAKIANILEPADIGSGLKAIPAEQRQQVLYYANGRWNSISVETFKNSLGNLRVILARLLSQHPLFENILNTQRVSTSSPAFRRRPISAFVALLSGLLSAGVISFTLQYANEKASRRFLNSKPAIECLPNSNLCYDPDVTFGK